MALTPDDVVTKQFQHVRFKDGFDPDEVDEFLDEIVVEWRKTIEENTELKARVESLESREPDAAVAGAVVQEVAVATPADVPASVPATDVTATVSAPVSAGSPVTKLSTSATAGIIELAQRLHDEHVAEGEARRAELISEAESEVARIRAESETAEREQAERLNRERSTLEAQIAELREFESGYRTQLRGYIQRQLKDLDSNLIDPAAVEVGQ